MGVRLCECGKVHGAGSSPRVAARILRESPDQPGVASKARLGPDLGGSSGRGGVWWWSGMPDPRRLLPFVFVETHTLLVFTLGLFWLWHNVRRPAWLLLLLVLAQTDTTAMQLYLAVVSI